MAATGKLRGGTSYAQWQLNHAMSADSDKITAKELRHHPFTMETWAHQCILYINFPDYKSLGNILKNPNGSSTLVISIWFYSTCIVKRCYAEQNSLFSSAWLCQLSWNRNSYGVLRPSICGIDCLWTYSINFFQILVVASPAPYPQMFF